MGIRDHSNEFEESVLLSCLTNDTFRQYVASTIKPEYFQNIDYQYIYSLMTLLMVKQAFISFLSIESAIKSDYSLSDDKVSHYLGILEKLKKVDKEYYNSILESVRSSVEEYITNAKIKDHLSKSFQAWKAGQYQKILSDAKILEQECRLMDSKSSSFWGDTNLLLNNGDIWEAGIPLYIKGQDAWGQSSIIDDFLHFQGLKRGNLALVQAAPNIGKTTLLVNVAMAQMLAGYSVLFYSLEVDVQYLNTRAYSLLLDFNLYDVQNLDSKAIYNRLQMQLASNPNTKDIVWCEKPTRSISPSQIQMEIQSLQNKNKKPDVVIIDYLDLLKPDRYYKDNRRLEIQDITISLRQIAGENQVAIIAATQSNREAIKQGSSMGNIGEDFSKAQTADYLLALNRKETQVNQNGKNKTVHNYFIKIEKNRFGRVGDVIHLTEADMNKSRFFKVA